MSEQKCKICLLKHDHPGISLNEDGVCNLCELKVPSSMVENYEYSNRNYKIFKESKPVGDGRYDCLFMYSGGKDSTFMLDKFVNIEKRSILSYTFSIPFQSEHAMENINKIQSRIKIEYFIDSSDDNIRKLMRYIFNEMPVRTPGQYLDEKTPCMLCRDFFILRAIVYSFQNKIPFLVFCADPQQIITIQSNIKTIIKQFYKRVGRDLTTEFFGNNLEDILFAPDEDIPKIVFPYIAMRNSYKPEEIIEYLKSKDLYTSSPLETHCTMFPLLNYYSFNNYDCSFYRLNMASQVRGSNSSFDSKAATFGISFNKDGSQMVETESRYKKVIMDIVHNNNTDDERRAELRQVFTDLQFELDACDYLVEKYMSLCEIAETMGIKLPAGSET